MKRWRVFGAGLVLLGQLVMVTPALAAEQPYLKVDGGDVAAGARFATPGVASGCGSNHVANAGIATWNNRGDHSGAGTNYSATAFGSILDFVTAQSPSNSPYKLAFTNTAGVNVANGAYGGSFDASPCIDYWSNKPATGTADFRGGSVGGTNVGGRFVGGLNGNYVHSGTDVIISASTITDGKHSTVYVDGNVAIIGDIKYQNTSWNSRTNIPSFRLVVHGSIYIDASVKQLDGTYAAIPNSNFATAKNEFTAPIPGTITTCAIAGFSSYSPSNYQKNRIESACKNPLVVNGSLAANQIWFLRSTGSIGGSKVPAETVNYVPDTWIAPGSGGNSTTVDNSTYQSIIGLPPVL